VGVLVGGDGLEEDLCLLVLDERALFVVRGRLVVEGGLEVLEGEGVVEDANVTLAEFGGRASLAHGRHRSGGGESAEQRAAAHHGTTGKAGLLEEAESGVALQPLGGLVGGFADVSVYVDLLDVQLGAHGELPFDLGRSCFPFTAAPATPWISRMACFYFSFHPRAEGVQLLPAVTQDRAWTH
jgi:hypothetical protein